MQYPNRKTIRFLMIAFLGLSLALLLDVQPSHAQFLSQAENYFNTSLGDGNNGVIGLIFFALRAFFIYYVGSSLVETIRHMRTGESDWQETARKPIIAILIVGVADALSLLIIGG